VIVGDRHTFGKGTVQQLIPMERFLSMLSGGNGEAGALKLTIQKFYRVAGGSTQLEGVASDVVLPSMWDRDDLIGEKSLKNWLPYDKVPAADYQKTYNQPLFLEELRRLSAARVDANPEFQYIRDDVAKNLKETSEGNIVSLNEETRRGEIVKNKALKEKRTAERATRKPPELTVYGITLDNVEKPLELAKNDGKKYVDQWMEMDQETKDRLKAEKEAEKEAEKREAEEAEKKEASNADKIEPDKAEPVKPEIKKEPVKKETGKKEPVKKEPGKKAVASGKVASTPADEDDDDLDSEEGANAPVIDAVRAETLNITADLVEELRKAQSTPSTAQATES